MRMKLWKLAIEARMRGESGLPMRKANARPARQHEVSFSTSLISGFSFNILRMI